MHRCPPVPQLEAGAHLGTLVNYTQELVLLYGECALRHDTLIEASQ